MERLEHTANKERSRATELERELRKAEGRAGDRSSASTTPPRASWIW